MLRTLHIKRFAIVDELSLNFGAGLTVLSGETGAGKSILVDALVLALGGRAATELIRADADDAVVEALFDIRGREELRAQLDDAGFEAEGELLIRRVISRSGRNRVFINGALATVNMLRGLTSELAEIFSQHEHQRLLQPGLHAGLLDAYAGLAAQAAGFAAERADLRALCEEQRKLLADGRERNARIDYLKFQIDEIAQAELRDGEQEELESERMRLVNAEQLAGLSARAEHNLYSAEGSIQEQLAGIERDLERITSLDAGAGQFAQIAELGSLVDELAGRLRDYGADLESDPARLEAVEDRLNLIYTLQRKHGSTIAEVLASEEKLVREYEELSRSEERGADLGKQIESKRETVAELGERLDHARRGAAAKLREAITKPLDRLAFPRAVFEVQFSEQEPDEGYRAPAVEFLFSANPGEPPRPLAKTASGGELSRLMLALKKVTAAADAERDSVVLDEVDAGIGGQTALAVGKLIAELSANAQVLCITHLAQIAAYADHQYVVSKTVGDARTSVSVTPVTADERVAEIARMLSGDTGESSRAAARELLATGSGEQRELQL